MLVAATFVPALLAAAGRWVFWPARTPTEENVPAPSPPPRRRWSVRMAVRHPVVALIVVLVLVGAAASGLSRLAVGNALVRDLPTSSEVHQAYDQASRGFSQGVLAPGEVIVTGAHVAAQRAGLARLQPLISRQPDMAQVFGPRQAPLARRLGFSVAPSGTAARYVFFLRSDPLGATGISAVESLRARLPQLVREAGLSGATGIVAGDTALSADIVNGTVSSLARVIPLVLLAIFVIIALYLRALVAPLYLVLTSLLGVVASLGLTVWVLQVLLGWGQIDYYVLFTVGVLLISLGSDYSVFLVGRIWQEARAAVAGRGDRGRGQPGGAGHHDGRRRAGQLVRLAGDRPAAPIPGDRLRHGRGPADRHVSGSDRGGPSAAVARGPQERLAGPRAQGDADRTRIGPAARGRGRPGTSRLTPRPGAACHIISVPMFRYSYLFSQLVRRELRQKYKGSVLGVLWYFVNPLVIMALYGVMLGPLLKAVSIPDYPIFILAGLLVWLFFSQSLLAASGSLVEQSSLVSRVRFPREAVPAAVVAVQLVPFFAMLLMLLPVSLIIRGNASPALLELIPLVVLLFLFTLGLSLLVAVLHAYYRDVQPVLNAALMPLFFISGVLFQIDKLPGLHSHHWAGPLLRWGNPIAPFISSVRTVIFYCRTPDAPTLLYVAIAAMISAGLGIALFRRMEGNWRWSCEPNAGLRPGGPGGGVAVLPRPDGPSQDAQGGRHVAVRHAPPRASPTRALAGVTVRVDPGETVGVVGRNGAGKTSTLRVLAGIIPLHRGFAGCGGRVATLIELGAGFGREFTGRENMRLNARAQRHGPRGDRFQDR